MWKRTRGSCLTSKCKRLHSGVRVRYHTGRSRERRSHNEMWKTLVSGHKPARSPSSSTLSYFLSLTLRHAHEEIFLWPQSLIRFFFLIGYIKNSVLLPARSLTRLASKPPCSHFPSVCLRVGFEMNMLWQWTTLSHLSSHPHCNATHMPTDVKIDRCTHRYRHAPFLLHKFLLHTLTSCFLIQVIAL